MPGERWLYERNAAQGGNPSEDKADVWFGEMSVRKEAERGRQAGSSCEREEREERCMEEGERETPHASERRTTKGARVAKGTLCCTYG